MQLPALLFYGGTWFLLPSLASRHLYVVIACLDPIRNEDAYVGPLKGGRENGLDWQGDEEDHAIEDDKEREAAIKAKVLAKRRAREPQSISDLMRFSGLQRSTVVEALRVLTRPIFGGKEMYGEIWPDIPLIVKGKVPPRTPTWYAHNRHALGYYWPTDVLNRRTSVEKTRQALWPFFC